MLGVRVFTAVVGCLLLVACVNKPTPPAPPETPSDGAVAATPLPSDVPAGTPTHAPANPTPVASEAPLKRPTGPMTMDLRYGDMARLRYFDVTALRQEFGKDGISIGWKVRVCYRAAHSGTGADRRTRVSNNPWSVRVNDGEGPGTPPRWTAISTFPQDVGWAPEYAETRLELGGCQEGWMAVRHGNPDLQWTGLRYSPADFGDVITWS